MADEYADYRCTCPPSFNIGVPTRGGLGIWWAALESRVWICLFRKSWKIRIPPRLWPCKRHRMKRAEYIREGYWPADGYKP